eukprot:TRINITY_DN71125_c0_g1_i1.p1 TRINITY_DN71125_c0_g1~~TRINITY_DN71125_c0_g1_i1.p1  ORF type:complete len:304 (+),score=69.76 TRINITY_DN71125_c0_g1_i1:65-976(+)
MDPRADAGNATYCSAFCGGSVYEPRALVQEELYTILAEERTPVTYQWLTQRCALQPQEAARQLAAFAEAHPRDVVPTWHCEGVSKHTGANVTFLSDSRETAAGQLREPYSINCYGLTPVHDWRESSMDSSTTPRSPGCSPRTKRGRGEYEAAQQPSGVHSPEWAAWGPIAAELQRWWADPSRQELQVPHQLMLPEFQRLREAVHRWCECHHRGRIDHVTATTAEGQPLSLTLRKTGAGDCPQPQRRVSRTSEGRRTERAHPGPQRATSGMGVDVDGTTAMLQSMTLTRPVPAGWSAPGETCEE